MKSRAGSMLMVSILACAGQALSAPGDGETREPLAERVAVGLVNVPVFVEDSSGRSVETLKVSDFVVTEDGQPMRITNFAWVGAAEAAAAAVESSSPNLHVVLFVDSQNIQATHRQLVVKKLAPLIEGIDAEVPIMLAASTPSIEVLKAFSAPRAVLPYRLETLGQSAGGGLFDANASRQQREQIGRSVRQLQDCIRTPGCDLRSMEGAASSAVGEIRAYASGVADQTRGTLERFRHFAESLSSFPGTKSVLYVSDGFPMQAGKDLFDELAAAIDDVINKTDPGGQRERSGASDAGAYQRLEDIVRRTPMVFFSNDIAKAIEETTAAANANNVRIYTLQASALTNVSGADADDQAALRLLANATGGTFLQGGIRAEALLQQLLDDTHGYYSIAYAPPPSAERTYHAVEVKVKKHRTRARYPHGYLTRSEGSVRIEQVLAALFHGYGDNDAKIALDLGPGGRDKQEQPVIQVKVRIPVGSMLLEPRGDQYATELKLIVAVINAGGRATMLREFPVAVTIPGQALEQARGQDYPVTLTVPASRGTNRVAVGLWDASAARPALTHGAFDWTE